MSGGDVSSLSATGSNGSGTSAVDQLHALFKWASRSSKGLLLFIDEAEAFLSSRSGHTTQSSGTSANAGVSQQSKGIKHDTNSRNALNALLYQTGIQSTTFVILLSVY